MAQQQQKKPKKDNQPFSAFGAANKIEQNRYRTYKTMVETAGGKSQPLSFKQWKQAGKPTQ